MQHTAYMSILLIVWVLFEVFNITEVTEVNNSRDVFFVCSGGIQWPLKIPKAVGKSKWFEALTERAKEAGFEDF